MARPALTRERILDAAMAFVDERGVDALKMRELASSLGYEAMALYRHLKNKESIVEAGGSPRIEAAYRQLTQELTLFLLALRPVWTPQEMAEHHRRLVRELEGAGPPALRRHLEEGEAAVIAGLPGS